MLDVSRSHSLLDRVRRVDWLVDVHRSPRIFASPEFIATAKNFVRDSRIEDHAFFSLARASRSAAQLWAEQELIVSSAFSQALASWLALIDNVHLRALAMPVLAGEHGELVGDVASRAHPTLALLLCRSLGSELGNVRPLEATLTFVREMETASKDVMFGAGFFGIGNELMLLPEYREMLSVFELVAPESSFRSFLNANINEDEWHHEFLERLANGLTDFGFRKTDFLDGARKGVSARVEYYDNLAVLARRPGDIAAALSVCFGPDTR